MTGLLLPFALAVFGFGTLIWTAWRDVELRDRYEWESRRSCPSELVDPSSPTTKWWDMALEPITGRMVLTPCLS